MDEKESLDSFFAKKDKVKKKSNKTRITPDEIGQLLEKKLQKAANKSKKDRESHQEDSSKAYKQEDDDEWKVIEEEKEEKDISDLKIQNLGLISKGESDSGMGEGGGNTESSTSNDKDTPWRPVTASKTEEKKEEEEEKEEIPKLEEPVVAPVVPEPKAEVKPQKYIPPAARNQAMSGSTGMTRPRKKKPLDVSSVDDFPELGK